MGLFSSKIRTYVSSTVYNLAGDEDLRPDFLKSVILGSILYGGKIGMGEHLTRSLLSGTGMRQRRFYKWCNDYYDLGMPASAISASMDVPTDKIRAGLLPILGLASNQELVVSTAVIDDVDIDYWADDWIVKNRPELTEVNWTADYNKLTDEIVISIVDEPDVVLPAPADLIWGLDRGVASASKKLLFANYTILTQNLTTLEITTTPVELYTYRMGSGNVTFDTLESVAVPQEGFFPVLPLRINNVSASEKYDAATLTNIEKAFKKLTGSKFSKLLDSIEENESIGDIDYCFLVQGVNLTTDDKVGQAYIYRFLQSLMDQQISNKADYLEYHDIMGFQRSSVTPWTRWETAHNGEAGSEFHPEFGEPSPLINPQSFRQPTVSEVRIYGGEDLPDFDYRIRWTYIDESLHVGNGKTYDGDLTRGRMQVGEYWLHAGTPYTRTTTTNQGGSGNAGERYVTTTTTTPRLYLFKQYDAFRYSRLELVGLEHRNYVYIGHAVTTTAATALAEALADTEKNGESSFLIPLHYPTLTSFGLLKGTQMSSVSSYLVFNSYSQVKQRWYERGIFKLIIIIVSVAISIIFAPAGAALGAGILGTNLAVGAALGITGSAVITAIAGGIVNALAGMIVTSILSRVSIKLFGEKWGAIIGTIASFIAMQYGANYIETGSLNIDWSEIMRSENLISLTNAVSQAYTQWLNADTMDIYASMTDIKEEYDDELKKIEKLSDEILGMTSGLIDPMMLTDANEYFGESRDTYLGRTLLTGSDIAELTHSMIENFADISLELREAIR